jgi:hypothetical protein
MDFADMMKLRMERLSWIPRPNLFTWVLKNGESFQALARETQ